MSKFKQNKIFCIIFLHKEKLLGVLFCNGLLHCTLHCAELNTTSLNNTYKYNGLHYFNSLKSKGGKKVIKNTYDTTPLILEFLLKSFNKNNKDLRKFDLDIRKNGRNKDSFLKSKDKKNYWRLSKYQQCESLFWYFIYYSPET